MKNSGAASLVPTLFFILIFSCKNPESTPTNEITLESGLKYEILKMGHGEIARQGDEIIVQESMGYRDGSELYSIKDMTLANLPKVLIGGGQAIKGVDEGVRGMREGEIRKLIIPTSLSKRKQYPKFLSPDSTLVYQTELMEII
ncbi:MAG: FKBP-type peptidyl-prolyl cis-trans isomerase [Cyclobacteriaceae bacterium]